MFSMAVAGLAKSLIVATVSLHPAAAPPAHHTVQPGDTLSGIATANGTTWEQLWSDNRAAVADPNLIYPGQVLSVGGATATAYPGHPGQDSDDPAPAPRTASRQPGSLAGPGPGGARSPAAGPRIVARGKRERGIQRLPGLRHRP